MINAISYIVTGFLVGVLARFIYPGAVEMGWLWTTILGVAGSLLAGFVTSRGSAGFHRAGWIASVVGGLVLIFAGRMLHIGG